MPGIVVGVDGSEHSQRSLEWAMKEAALRQTPLTVLAVHPVAISTWTQTPLTYPQDEADEARARPPRRRVSTRRLPDGRAGARESRSVRSTARPLGTDQGRG